MPAKNSRKQYVENSYYHLYNRGVEKRKIFMNEQDYGVFLSYLKEYLMPKGEKELREKLTDTNLSYKERDKILKQLMLNNFADEITLLAYCLMPNHFHFFVKQKNAGSIDVFMNSLCTRYTMYFNRKYKRVGPLYQGVYKAVQVTTDEQYIYLTKYIHKQAQASNGKFLVDQPSSYLEFLGKRKSLWVKPDEVLSYFSKNNPVVSYKEFVEEISEIEFAQVMLDEDQDA